MTNKPPFSTSTYKARRDALRSAVGSGTILLLGNQNAPMNYKENYYHFRQDSSFLYYFGLDLPDLMAVIDCDSGKDYILGDDLTIDHIVWTGPQPSISELASGVGVTETRPLKDIKKVIGSQVHYLPPYRGVHTLQLGDILNCSINEINKDGSEKLVKAIIAQRNIKTAEEITEMHKACTITSKMHHAVISAVRPGMYEHELVGVAHKVAADHNVHFAYPAIMTKNGQTLHNHYHGNQLSEGDLVLYDGGTDAPSHYSGDMTRTFPVSKTFTAQQKEIYQLVHDMYTVAQEMLAPGVSYKSVHLQSATTMVDGLKAIGLMKGDTADAVSSGAYAMFFPHGLGHMIGLDVHDMENLGENLVGYGDDVERSTMFGLKSLRLGQKLQAGNCITVEPGIYFIPELMDMWKAEDRHADYLNFDAMNSYRDFGGIRLEDDYAITADGSELLGEPLVGDAEGIERIRG